ncbi:hypothetical protein MP638_006050 [Amoeboaphelidium occidentale]|nr:hypothetical protein MP638_006050 [Amoeboaphelidium occidentale]
MENACLFGAQSMVATAFPPHLISSVTSDSIKKCSIDQAVTTMITGSLASFASCRSLAGILHLIIFAIIALPRVILAEQGIMTFTGHSGFVNSVFVGSDGYLYSGSFDDTIKKWNTATGEAMMTFTGHSSTVNSVFVGPDGYLYSGSLDNTIKKWNTRAMLTTKVTTPVTTTVTTPNNASTPQYQVALFSVLTTTFLAVLTLVS